MDKYKIKTKKIFLFLFSALFCHCYFHIFNNVVSMENNSTFIESPNYFYALKIIHSKMMQEPGDGMNTNPTIFL